MVCCAIISLILAGLFWPARAIFTKLRPHKTPALMWHLAAKPSAVAAHSPAFSPSHKQSHSQSYSHGHSKGYGVQIAARFSLAARAKSVSYALAGLGFVIRNEHNARIHIAAAFVVIALGAAFRINLVDWSTLIMAIISVWFAETINTAFEYLCDVVSPEKNESVRRAKDIAAGAVLITAIGALIIGTLVMFPHFKNALTAVPNTQSHAAMMAESLCFVR